LAGLRDTHPDTIFDRIVAGEIPVTKVKEDDKILAFKDINPVAPAHVLVIPKNRQGLTRVSKASPEHYEILGRLMVAAGEIARDESLGFGNGARIVVNDGEDGRARNLSSACPRHGREGFFMASRINDINI
jgi:diadenosine tetraphosphate (Ap4A) HIT family hydrolase